MPLEDAREKYEIGTIERALIELAEVTRLTDISREATNAVNRAKTQSSKALNGLVLNETIQKGDKLIVGDVAYSYDYAISESLPFEKIFKLYEDGQITKETFFKVCSVSKTTAVTLIGAHIVDDLTDTKIGNKADIRTEKLPKPITEPYRIEKKKPPKPKVVKGQTLAVPRGGTKTARKTRRIRV